MATIDERVDSTGKVIYRAQVRLKGFSSQRATFERKTDAKLWAQQTEAAIREGRYFRTVEAKRRTVAEMIDRYMRDVLPQKKGIKAQGPQLLWWKKQIGSTLLADVTPSLLGEQRDKLLRGTTVRGRVRSPSTTVRYIAALSHVFSIAIRE
jgi:hypothetical protein